MIDQVYDPFKTRVIGTELKFTWAPKKCHLTGKKLWLQKAYKQTAMWSGPGDALFEYRWYNRTEFLIERLKGNI